MSPSVAERSLPRQAGAALVAVSSWQLVAMAAAFAGNVLLARLLGPRLLGAYAVSAFLLGLLALVIDFGIGAALIRRPGASEGPDQDPRRAPHETFEATAFGLTLFLLLAGGAIVLVAAPPLTTWYRDPDVGRLLRLCFPGVALGLAFRLSISLLEKDLLYREVAVTEALGTSAFYLGAAGLAAAGVGAPAFAVGELLRGAAGVLAFRRRPFPLRPRWHAASLRELTTFGVPYVGSTLVFNLTGAVNGVVVARLLGLEAAGVVRLAEGLVNQLTLLKRVGERIASPVLARVQASRGRVRRTVMRGQVFQFVLGTLPLLSFIVVAGAVVPWLYGPRFAPVAPLLPLLGLGVAVSTAFGLHSRALVTVGRNTDVLLFHLAYAILHLGLAPWLVVRFGLTGYGLAALAPLPAYWRIHRSFTAAFGALSYRRFLRIALPVTAGAVLAGLLLKPAPGLAVFAAALALVAGTERRALRHLRRVLRLRAGSA